MSLKKLLAVLLAMVVIGGAALFGAMAGGVVVFRLMSQQQAAAIKSTPTQTAIEAIPVTSDPGTLVVNTTDVETAVTQAVQSVGPTVVTVVASIPGQNTFFGYTGDSTSTGSGVFISSVGYILTNNHVIEGASQFQVVYADGTQHDASLVGTDQYSDLAVLKVNDNVPSIAKLGNSDALNPGETVIAIGSPLGDFKNTVTAGVVSATGRSIDTGYGYSIDGLIQTDAAINQGNSGGPLVNLAGEVIAINTLIIRNSGSGTVAEGLGFAIPINTARAVSEQIIQKGYVSRPNLGISYQPITPRVAAIYRLPVQYGVYITDIAPGGPADKASLQVGDIITAIDQTNLDETHAYINTLFLYKAGDAVTLAVNRNGKQIQVQVTLGESAPQ
ncbi:MAG TPA: trypsin-like peptidase domain-containing protein [Anaerolineales bacterium]|nr:trypsin-like peptidase domain-containing protein [Anaerolineales bacterium]